MRSRYLRTSIESGSTLLTDSSMSTCPAALPAISAKHSRTARIASPISMHSGSAAACFATAGASARRADRALTPPRAVLVLGLDFGLDFGLDLDLGFVADFDLVLIRDLVLVPALAFTRADARAPC